jgi:pilus assembly protein Flp/PilA
MFSVVTYYQYFRDGLRKHITKFSNDESGVTMLEYTILIGIITVAVILAVVYAGSWVTSKWNLLTTALT